MKRPLFVRAFLLFCLLALSLPRAAAEELTLPRLVKAMADSSPELKKEEFGLLKARSLYLEQMAFLYPTIFLNLPAGFGLAPFSDFSYASGLSTRLSNGSSWDLAPSLTVSQVLPTMGTLDLTLKNTLTIADPGTTDDPFIGPFIPENAFMDFWTVSLNLRQPIFFEDAFGASLVVLEETFRLAEARFLSARNEIVYQAARAFYGLKQLKYAEQLALLSLENARFAHEDAKKKLASGTATPLAVLKEEARVKKAELDYFDASSAFATERARLVAAYRLKPDDTVTEAEEPAAFPPPPAAGEIRARAEARNPELLMGRKNLAIRKARVTTVKCEQAHTLTLGSSLLLDSADPFATSLEDALADPFDGTANPRLSFTFKLSFKLFDGGAGAEKIRQAAYDAEIGALELEAGITELSARIESAAARLERTRLAVGYTETALAAAGQEADKARRDFALGQISRLELDRQEAAYRSARLESLRAKNDRSLALLDVYRLMGDDLLPLLTGGPRP